MLSELQILNHLRSKCQFHDLVVISQGNITTGNEIVGQWLTTGLRPAVATTRQFHYQ